MLFIAILIAGFIGFSRKKKPVLVVKKSMITVVSAVFTQNASVPKKYTCDGDSISPPLSISNFPENSKSLVLIVDDPDAPMGTFTHWLLWNINPSNPNIMENSVPSRAVIGKNSAGAEKYFGPCPPTGTHHYQFTVYALDMQLNLPLGSDRAQLEEAMQNHIIDKATLTGLYHR